MKKLIVLFIFSIGFCMSLSASEKEGDRGITKERLVGSKAISADGLVASYDFETYTSDGLLHDFSPLENHGKLIGKPSIGKTLTFSKKEDVVILPDNSNLNLTGPITVAARLKITTPNLHQHVFACNDLFVLWLTNSNKYRFADTLGQGFTTEKGVDVVSEGKWHTVVAVLSANKGDSLNKENIKIFIDGVQMDGNHEKTWAPTELAATNACVIGGTRNGVQGHQDLPFKGSIDELQIYSRAFTDEEVKIYANYGL
ncbi:hypothetical protein GCM10007978_49880 [Shewanella hanedai]|uniref:LamG domain-containing protein n=1 Tax=Shewanella hanedai TaxID=25 RepID=A0A553JKS8_SHEHA|nr:LamG domain-containing protein [Shewanella hanedai]TRY13060.1 LamG domain-containing protein [Shewanella hanedai]GGJ06338.1 hypothetical protein GCM10007978_49880 [Shewanella hanedai]